MPRGRTDRAAPRRALARLVATLAVLGPCLLGRADAATWTELAPIVNERCTLCHAGPSAAAGLRLDSLKGLLAGSTRGPVVRAGDPADSELIGRLRGTRLPRMPMTGPPFLADAQIALFETWIANGLPEGRAAAPTAAAPAAAPVRPDPGAPAPWSHVAPIFATRCAKCHADSGLLGPPPEGYRLTSYAAALDATDRARIVPGRPQASELLRKVQGRSLPRMPMDGPPWLADDEIALIEAWIAGGARDASGTPAPVPAGARVRLQGTWSGGGLDGLPLRMDPATRLDRRLAPGARVEVRGQVGADGGIVAERVRGR